MADNRRASTAHALRSLAAPVSVLSLVVLALNDHVLKQAWPGLVTGKLSDVAGLVVAPLLLAVLLAAMGVRRALPVATILTGLGFVFTKTSAAGAAATSAVWSLFGIPTMIRADVTDLVALPALGVAWWVDRRVGRSRHLPWRQTAAVASGIAVLPVAVLATAATSCGESLEITHVARVEGDFPGKPRVLEQRLVVGESSWVVYTIDASRVIHSEDVQVTAPDESGFVQCDPTDADECWRILGDGVVIEHSLDGGATWESEVDLTDDQLEALREEIGDQCGDEPQVGATDLAVLPTDGEPLVVVSVGHAGLYVREADGRWELYSISGLYEWANENAPDPPPPPQVTPLDQPTGGPQPDQADPSDEASRSTPTCPSSTPTTVTPHPSNGPPTTYLTCP